jgi:glucokinase
LNICRQERRLSAYVRQIPTKLILSQDAAMLGAASALRNDRAAKH